MFNALFMIFAAFLVFAAPLQAETFDFTSSYPAPAGFYKNLYLKPQPAINPANNCPVGTIYVNSSDGSIPYFCHNDLPLSQYRPFGNIWTLSGNNLFLTDTSNPELKKVGIGTSTPVFKLTLDQDGAIFADNFTTDMAGSFNLPADIQNSALVWHPLKAAFRAGFSSAPLSDLNIGVYSVAMGADNTASGGVTTVWGGQNNSATQGWGTIAGGKNNSAGEYTQILGGEDNSAVSNSVVAGKNTDTTAADTTISGGENNIISAQFGVIAGGKANNNSGFAATISGGSTNVVNGGQYAVISGGSGNTTNKNYTVIAGGWQNTASGYYAVVSGGSQNTASGNYSVVSGGYDNRSSAIYAAVTGGTGNQCETDYCNITGGAGNRTTSGPSGFAYNSIIGGQSNAISNYENTILGGSNNQVDSYRSITGGRNITLNTDNINNFIWGYADAATNLGSMANTFYILSGRVGIRDTFPAALLEINGNESTDDYLNITSTSASAGDIMTIKNDGSIGVGNNNPIHPLHFGNGAYVSTTGNFMPASSRKYKENISDLTTEDALSAFAKLSPVVFNYTNEPGHRYLGFIAEDVPDLTASENRTGVAAIDVATVLTKVVIYQKDLLQEQQKETKILLQRLNALKTKARGRTEQK